jgi:hypothetical protein
MQTWHNNGSRIEFTTKDGRATSTVCVDNRIAFGIAWFFSEEDAAIAHDAVCEENRTYNGGFSHGMPCGRDRNWDRQMDGVQQYAVTF